LSLTRFCPATIFGVYDGAVHNPAQPTRLSRSIIDERVDERRNEGPPTSLGERGGDRQMIDLSQTPPIILYDGLCGLCNRLVQFVLRRDPHDRFRFASLQSDVAHAMLRRHGANADDLDTMFVVLDADRPTERVATRSDAVRIILREIGGVWAFLAGIGAIVPRAGREWLYEQIARHRYRVFGRYESCPVPSARDRAKFID